MRTLMLALTALTTITFAGQLAAQAPHDGPDRRPRDPFQGYDPTGPNPPAPQEPVMRLQNKDQAHPDSHDRPVGVVQVRVGLANTPSPKPDQAIDVDTWTPPVGKEIPTFYGEPAGKTFVLLLDASDSMSGARMASLRAEASNLISKLDKDNKFDCMAYGTQFADSTTGLWGKLTVASEGHKKDATEFVNGSCCNPGLGTPTHDALKAACATYPADLGKMFLVSAGLPNSTGSVTQIHQHFPAWWAKFNHSTALVCVCIGGIEGVVNFMRDLAAQDDSTGVFVNVP